MKVVFTILNNNLKFSQICLSGHANLVQILFGVNILLLQEIYRREHTSDTISKYFCGREVCLRPIVAFHVSTLTQF